MVNGEVGLGQYLVPNCVAGANTAVDTGEVVPDKNTLPAPMSFPARYIDECPQGNNRWDGKTGRNGSHKPPGLFHDYGFAC